MRGGEIDDDAGDDGRGGAGARTEILLTTERNEIERGEENVEKRLGELRVNVGEIGAERRDVLGETLIGVADTIVEIEDAVVDLVAHVSLGGVLGETSAKRSGEHSAENNQGR
jgi:hypothetical protein